MPFKAYLFDLDGTIYRGNEQTPHAAETLTELRKRGALMRFLTNNSGADPDPICEKLKRMGIEAHPEEVVTSGMAAAAFLQGQALKRASDTAQKGAINVRRAYGRLFVIGEPGLVRILRKNGLEVANADTDELVRPDENGPYDAVVCGICRSFTYDLLNAALQAIRGGAEFVATNADATYPIECGKEQPGAGAIVAALQTCSGVEPRICGKPQPDMVFMALESCGANRAKALLVGDRMDTDIAAAKAAGVQSVLVMTGVSKFAPEGIETIQDLSELLGTE